MATTVQGWKAVEQVMRELGYPYSERWLRTLAKDPPKGCSLLPVYAIGRRGRIIATREGLAAWVETNRVHLSVERAA